MNEEMCCITNSDFLPALYIVYKKLEQLFFHALLANLFKKKDASVLVQVIHILAS